ncbi:protein MANBAL [Ambystoma mexicanum]|uniref:protein MANBAL n=1 Tax=Ambystoma mexicanum TaxID=8296 RepID=UPI0037E7D41F
MAAELDLSPPDIPEPTFLENLLHYGLFIGAIFQLVCILAIIYPTKMSQQMDADHSEVKCSEPAKKQKPVTTQVGKKLKKEPKKKR